MVNVKKLGYIADEEAPMAPGQTLLVDRPRTGITVATLNRPDQLNALTFGMFDAADACAPAWLSRPQIRAATS